MLIGRFYSSRSEDVIYEVSTPEPDDGTYRCTCKGFEFRQTCGHIEAVQRWIKSWGIEFPVAHIFAPPVPWTVTQEDPDA